MNRVSLPQRLRMIFLVQLTSGDPMRLSSLLTILVFFIQAHAPAASHVPERARHGMVVSAQRIASGVGVEVMKKGGNAVDAAIATGFALAVVYPAAGNIGGGGFMIVRQADGTAGAFDFRETAPAAATSHMFLDSTGAYSRPTNHEGYLSIGVPGTVAGFFAAHKKYGSLPMRELIAPAILLAEEGFPVSWALHDDFVALDSLFRMHPATARVFLRDGTTPYEPGEIFRQPDLAATLRRIQKEGRDGFYRGETANMVAAAMKKHGGFITAADLAAYRVHERDVLTGSYHGYDILAMPPISSGGTVLLEMLNILEGFDLAAMGHNSAMHIHVAAEAMRRAYADRARHLGDPAFNPDMPVQRLISKPYAAGLRRTISLNRASKSDPVAFNDAEGDHTTHFSVIDPEGNAVVVTYTLEQSYGAKIVAEGTGFLLNDEMGDFNPWPGHTDTTGMIGTPPNIVAPGKRMLSSMTPTMVTKNGKPFLLIGSPGGRKIINTVLQVISNVVDFRMDLGEAIGAPRFHHQWLPDILYVEKFGTTRDSQRLLEMYGHRVVTYETSRWQGSAMGVLVDPVTGILYGMADPRQPDGAAVGF